jgi:hypothetical protein
MIKMIKMRTMRSRKVTMTATMAVNKETSRSLLNNRNYRS